MDDRSCNFHDSAAETTADRLSDLPEGLLLQIISQLPMEDAVRTGALSTKWKNLWKHADEITVSHPIHKLRDGSSCEVMVKDFVSIVNGALIQYSRRNIKRFSLMVERVYDIANEVLDKWFQWVYLRNVEILMLKLPMSVYCAPDWFSHNSSMEKLDIEGPADVKFCDGVVNWTSLRSLSLSSVDISDEDIAKVMLGCPVLETLALINVSGMSKLNVVSSTVKEVRVIDRRSDDDKFFEVDAPWIQHLEISGSYRGGVLRLKNVSSLLTASLTFERMDHFYRQFDADLLLGREAQILEAIRHVEDLTLGREFIQILSVLKLVGKPCPSFKCKHLILHSRALKHELPGIAYLLQNSPRLETLELEVESPTIWEDNFANYLKGVCEFDGAMYLSAQKADFPRLKSIKVSRNFYSCSHRDAWRKVQQFDIELALHIARYAHYMEKLTITSPRKEEAGNNCSMNCVSQYFSRLSCEIFQSFRNFSDVEEWELSMENMSSTIVCRNTKFVL